MEPVPSVFLHSGWLSKKQGGTGILALGKGWHRKWFVLGETAIWYFDSPSKTTPTAKIRLHGALIQVVLGSKQAHAFNIRAVVEKAGKVAQLKTVQLAAPSEFAMAEWFYRIKRQKEDGIVTALEVDEGPLASRLATLESMVAETSHTAHHKSGRPSFVNTAPIAVSISSAIDSPVTPQAFHGEVSPGRASSRLAQARALLQQRSISDSDDSEVFPYKDSDANLLGRAKSRPNVLPTTPQSRAGAESPAHTSKSSVASRYSNDKAESPAMNATSRENNAESPAASSPRSTHSIGTDPGGAGAMVRTPRQVDPADLERIEADVSNHSISTQQSNVKAERSGSDAKYRAQSALDPGVCGELDVDLSTAADGQVDASGTPTSAGSHSLAVSSDYLPSAGHSPIVTGVVRSRRSRFGTTEFQGMSPTAETSGDAFNAAVGTEWQRAASHDPILAASLAALSTHADVPVVTSTTQLHEQPTDERDPALETGSVVEYSVASSEDGRMPTDDEFDIATAAVPSITANIQKKPDTADTAGASIPIHQDEVDAEQQPKEGGVSKEHCTVARSPPADAPAAVPSCTKVGVASDAASKQVAPSQENAPIHHEPFIAKLSLPAVVPKHSRNAVGSRHELEPHEHEHDHALLISSRKVQFAMSDSEDSSGVQAFPTVQIPSHSINDVFSNSDLGSDDEDFSASDVEGSKPTALPPGSFARLRAIDANAHMHSRTDATAAAMAISGSISHRSPVTSALPSMLAPLDKPIRIVTAADEVTKAKITQLTTELDAYRTLTDQLKKQVDLLTAANVARSTKLSPSLGGMRKAELADVAIEPCVVRSDSAPGTGGRNVNSEAVTMSTLSLSSIMKGNASPHPPVTSESPQLIAEACQSPVRLTDSAIAGNQVKSSPETYVGSDGGHVASSTAMEMPSDEDLNLGSFDHLYAYDTVSPLPVTPASQPAYAGRQDDVSADADFCKDDGSKMTSPLDAWFQDFNRKHGHLLQGAVSANVSSVLAPRQPAGYAARFVRAQSTRTTAVAPPPPSQSAQTPARRLALQETAISRPASRSLNPHARNGKVSASTKPRHTQPVKDTSTLKQTKSVSYLLPRGQSKPKPPVIPTTSTGAIPLLAAIELVEAKLEAPSAATGSMRRK